MPRNMEWIRECFFTSEPISPLRAARLKNGECFERASGNFLE